jgi:sucrose-6-phosphate hydrolase SacC (GH32 family)
VLTAEGLDLPPGPLDIEVRLPLPATLTLAVDHNTLNVAIDPATGNVELHRPVTTLERADRPATARIAAGTDVLDLRLLIDGSVIELFVPDGPAFTERLYPTTGAGHPALRLHGPQDARADITIWQLRTTGAR